MKGGYHPDSRAAQELAELVVDAGVYAACDRAEDGLIGGLLGDLRRTFAASPASLLQLDRWEAAWRAADRRADGVVADMAREAVRAARLLEVAGAEPILATA